MIRKLALGLVAAATLGVAALAPTAASAFSVKVGVGPTWYPHYHRVYVAPPLMVGAPLLAPAPTCVAKRLVQTRKGLRWRYVNVCAF